MSRYGLLSDIKKIFTSTVINILALLRYKLGGGTFGLNTTEKRDKRIVVTLTTIPSRMGAVQISLDCLLRQSVKPDKVIVNLGQELFEGISLPNGFKILESRGVEIRYVPYLCPHSKYFYTMQDFPEDIVITFDDDVIYQKRVIEELMKSYKRHPRSVSCLRAHKMIFDEHHILLPYNQWEYETTCVDIQSTQIFSTGAGGVLYPPHVLNKDVFHSGLLSELCFRADDVWLKAMELLNHTSVVLASKDYRRLTLVRRSQRVALKKTNIRKAENDICIQNVFQHYGITYSDFQDQ